MSKRALTDDTYNAIVAARLANIAAGIVVGKVGTAVAREADLLAALSPQASALRKIVTLDHAAEQGERWRRKGWRVGFTNGCFDLLHPGHVHLLEQARGACDRLVVGLNSDASVRRLKGASRPVQPETAQGCQGDVTMAEMGGIEGSAVEADPQAWSARRQDQPHAGTLIGVTGGSGRCRGRGI